MLYKKILVPHDGSKPADNALDHAVKLAKFCTKEDESIEIILLYVVEEIHFPPPSALLVGSGASNDNSAKRLVKDLYQEMTVEANTILKERRNKFESSGISIKSLSIIGHHPVDKIIEFADNEKADLIIMGSTGLRGISKIKVLGSVSRGVAEKATISCPVMLVH